MGDRSKKKGAGTSVAGRVNPKTARQYLSDLLHLTPPLTAAFFALTIFHEWGFFSAIGGEYQSLVTTSDYVANAILWLPGYLLLMFGAPFAHLLWDELPKRTKPSDFLAYGAGAALIVLSVVWFFKPSPSYRSALLVPFGFYLIGIYFLFNRNREFSSTFPVRAIAFAIPAICFAYTIGYDEGNSPKIPDVYQIKLKGDAELHPVGLLRSMEKGVLIREPKTEAVLFYRWDSVEFLKRKSGITHFEGYACRWFNYGCPYSVP